MFHFHFMVDFSLPPRVLRRVLKRERNWLKSWPADEVVRGTDFSLLERLFLALH